MRFHDEEYNFWALMCTYFWFINRGTKRNNSNIFIKWYVILSFSYIPLLIPFLDIFEISLSFFLEKAQLIRKKLAVK